MEFLSKLWAAGDVLQEGKKLADSATWKRAQIATQAVAGLLTAAFVFVPGLHVDDATVKAIAGGVYGVFSVYQMWSTAATTTTIGYKPSK